MQVLEQVWKGKLKQSSDDERDLPLYEFNHPVVLLLLTSRQEMATLAQDLHNKNIKLKDPCKAILQQQAGLKNAAEKSDPESPSSVASSETESEQA